LTYANRRIAATYIVKEAPDRGILEAYEKDAMATGLRTRIPIEEYIVETSEGYIRYHGKVYVPSIEQVRLTRQAHAAVVYRY